MDRSELVKEIEKLRIELEKKSSVMKLTASELLELSRKLDTLINRYIASDIQEKQLKGPSGGSFD